MILAEYNVQYLTDSYLFTVFIGLCTSPIFAMILYSVLKYGQLDNELAKGIRKRLCNNARYGHKDIVLISIVSFMGCIAASLFFPFVLIIAIALRIVLPVVKMVCFTILDRINSRL